MTSKTISIEIHHIYARVTPLSLAAVLPLLSYQERSFRRVDGQLARFEDTIC